MMDRELLWHGFAVSAAHPYFYVTVIMADADCAFVLLYYTYYAGFISLFVSYFCYYCCHTPV